MTYAVEFNDVSRLYGDVRAVDGVSIAIRDGEFFSMLGPSGSGKTTCLRLIAGFEQLSGGSIRIFWPACQRITAMAARREHGFSGLRVIPSYVDYRQCRLRADGERLGKKRTPPSRPASIRKKWRLALFTRVNLHSFPAASGSGLPLPARWLINRGCCS